ncbi:MAG: histidinol-phosphatase [Clostridia bacterium]|nr:histidinol-phosphatase [Clostridia bacterium]
MIFSGYHNHTIFCDGKNTAEEMVEEAIRLGCPELGFSGHCYTPFDNTYCMSQEETEEYIETVKKLKEKYASKIKILLGIEQDYYAPLPPEGLYDYMIGSVHYAKKNGECYEIDHSEKVYLKLVNEVFDGDYYALAENYFAAVADVYNKTKCDIIGHFDLVLKYNRDNRLFDPTHPRYVAASTRAFDALCKTPAIFELNTGAIARGMQNVPYPAFHFLESLKEQNKPVLLSADCHDKNSLLFAFERYAAFATLPRLSDYLNKK